MVPVLLLALLSLGAGRPAAPAWSAGSAGARPLLSAATAPAASSAPGDSLCVVAHVPEDSLGADVTLVRRIFLLRQRFWPDGTPARPVNLPASSPVRERFSVAVLEASVRDLSSYWDERYFHGTRPPLSVASEEAVLLFVARTRGAVGYVDGPRAGSLPRGVGRMFCMAGASAGQGAPGTSYPTASLKSRLGSSLGAER